MKIEFTPEQLKYKEEFRIFVDTVIIPEADRNDRDEHMCTEIYKKMSEKGYMGSMILEDMAVWRWI